MAGCQISRPSIKRAKAVLASVSAAAAADPKKSTRYVPSFNPSMLDKPKPKAFDDDEPDEVEQMGDVHASQTLHALLWQWPHAAGGHVLLRGEPLFSRLGGVANVPCLCCLQPDPLHRAHAPEPHGSLEWVQIRVA
eukprot:scaffold10832_cov33-Tisochrysis_lutea.AAC.1